MHVVAAGIGGEAGHEGALVVQIAEHDRLRRAGLRAGRCDVAVTHTAVLEARAVLGAPDALHAEGALLHHTLLAYRDVRVEEDVERVGPALPLAAGLREVVPVEVADLVGAVVRAIARADAAVVHLAVEPDRKSTRLNSSH